jgi:hypothetical protein
LALGSVWARPISDRLPACAPFIVCLSVPGRFDAATALSKESTEVAGQIFDGEIFKGFMSIDEDDIVKYLLELLAF